MPSREWRVRIEDMLEAIDRVESYVARMDFNAFVEDVKTVQAVERNLEIIGEAAANLPDEVVEQWPALPWYQMRGLRNVIAHEYFGVDVGILWQTASEDLPSVRPLLAAMLDASR